MSRKEDEYMSAGTLVPTASGQGKHHHNCHDYQDQDHEGTKKKIMNEDQDQDHDYQDHEGMWPGNQYCEAMSNLTFAGKI